MIQDMKGKQQQFKYTASFFQNYSNQEKKLKFFRYISCLIENSQNKVLIVKLPMASNDKNYNQSKECMTIDFLL